MKYLSSLLIIILMLGIVGCTETWKDPTSPVLIDTVKNGAYTTAFVTTILYIDSKSVSNEDVESIRDTAAAARAILTEETEPDEVLDSINELIDHIDDEQVRSICRGLIPSLVVMARQLMVSEIGDQWGEDAEAWAELSIEASKEALRGCQNACDNVLATPENNDAFTT